MSWLTAAAKLMVAMPRPVDVLIGERNRPNDARDPKVMASTVHAAAISIHIAAVPGRCDVFMRRFGRSVGQS